MKNNKGDFITELLKSKELNVSQKERIFQLVAKEKDLTVLMEIDLIKEELQSLKDIMTSSIADFDFNEVIITEEMLSMFNDGSGTHMADNKNDAGKFKPDLTINDPLSHTVYTPITISNILEKKKKVKNEGNNLKQEQLIPKNDNNSAKLKYLDPKNSIEFLTEFNDHPILRYTSHNVDPDGLTEICNFLKIDNYNFDSFLVGIKNEFYKLTEVKYKNKINKNLKGLIGEYINNYIRDEKNKGWSEDKIRMTWSSDDLKKWASENDNICPNRDSLKFLQCEIQPIVLKSGLRLNTFSEVVHHFKKQIHFRVDNTLKSHIEIVNHEFNDKATFDLHDVQTNFQFLTYVEKVKQAYRKIIEMSIEHQKIINENSKPEFKISLYENKNKSNNSIIFSILHKNSIFGKTVYQLEERNGKSFSSLIKEQINGTCNLKIKADFNENDFYEIMIWPKCKKKKLKDKVNGVQFDLIFNKIQ